MTISAGQIIKIITGAPMNLRAYISLLTAVLFTTNSYAGVFLLEGQGAADDGEKVVHPHGYQGTGGDVFVKVCITPGTPNQDQMVQSVRNAVATWNGMAPVTGNLSEGDQTGLAPNEIDFESLMLHELGHCIGLGHPNMSGGPGSSSDATVSGRGLNNSFDILAGSDYILGSQDDIRVDDINYHRFAPGVNDPFLSVGPVVDRSTYTRDLIHLPIGHTFAANAGRSVASRKGLPPTEAVMQQGVSAQEVQRQLVADDVDTLRYARSGLDGIQGTSDDYRMTLVYDGIRTGCDIQVRQESLSPGALGYCTRGSMNTLSTGHFGFGATATIRTNSNVNWHYAGQQGAAAYPFYPATCESTPKNRCSGFGGGKLISKPGKLKMIAKDGGIARFQVPNLGANFAGCLYSGSRLVKQWDMPASDGLRMTANMIKYKGGGVNFKGGKGRMKFKAAADVTLDPNAPVSLQVVSGIDHCWGTRFDADLVQANPNKAGVIKAKY